MTISEKKLIILTSQFPYGTKESFLELEIKALSKVFSRISIVPTTSHGTPRELPLNCQIVDLPKSLMGKRKYLEFINPKGLYEVASLLFNELRLGGWRELFKAPIKSIKKAFFIYRYSKWVKHGFFEENSNLETVIYSYWFDSIILAWRKYNGKVALVCRSHSSDTYKYLTDQILKYNLISCIKKIYCISDFVSHYLKNSWNVPDDKLETSRLGVQTTSIQKKAYPNESGDFTIVSCSSLIPLKRVDAIAKAILNLKCTKKIKWLHFGDGECKDLIEDMIFNNHNEKIELKLMGDTPNEKVIDFYNENNVDLFVNYSTSEGIPVSIMEAFSSSVPSICPNVGACSELVKDGYNGILLKENATIKDLTNAIMSIIELSIENKNIMNNNAVNTVNEHYSLLNYTNFSEELNRLN